MVCWTVETWLQHWRNYSGRRIEHGSVPSLSGQCHGTSKLGHWRSEQFVKYIMVAPIVLCGVIDICVIDVHKNLSAFRNVLYGII